MEPMNTAATFEWDDRYLLGHRAMDDTHREFVDLVDSLLTVGDQDFAAALDAFARHAEGHFEEENRLMDQHDFPARGCHADEHLVRSEIAELELLQHERRTRALGHRGSDLHGSPSSDGRRVRVTLENCAHPARVSRAACSGGAA